MGGRHRKKFIDKKDAVKFQLVHRSQKDPLFLDERLGEHVLMPVNPNTSRDLVALVNGIDLNARPSNRLSAEEIEKRKMEQHKYGVYFDDDYNYLQHLKEVDDDIKLDGADVDGRLNIDGNNNEGGEKIAAKPKLQLPSSVFASAYEEDVGYFNLNAPDNDPKINWDPEIVQTLDEDTNFDFDDPDNELEDDFFIKATKEVLVEKPSKKGKVKPTVVEVPEDDDDEYEDVDTDEDEEEDDEDGSDSDTYTGGSNKGDNGGVDGDEDGYDQYDEDASLKEFETKSRFTDYSMTSSVIRRNEKLQHLDKHFESIYAQYDEDQIGALDVEDIDGYADANDLVLKKAMEEMERLTTKVEYQTEKREKKVKDDSEEEESSGSEDETEESGDDDGNEREEFEYIYVKDDQDDRLDCESILDTYSTTTNLPQVIRDDDGLKRRKRTVIRISKKTGLPIVDEGSLKKFIEQDRKPQASPTPMRRPDETKEEKKARKQAVKEQRKERRIEKKINKLAFKEEKKCQLKGLKGLKEAGCTVKLT